jgi:mannan endo-1,4-beta-mannosidase
MNYLTSEQNNPVENLVEIYQSDYCITLDELPDLKTYPITEGDVQPEETTESSEETSDTADADGVVYGDVNEDGSVSIADVLTLNKNLMIGEELTAASSRNADVDLDGKPTSADALNILKYTVKIIAELPVK